MRFFSLAKLFLLLASLNSFDPASADFGVVSGVVVGGGAAIIGGIWKRNVIKCSFFECCDHPNWHLKNLTGLKAAFGAQLYGQHLVAKTVFDALRSHLSKTRDNPPSHPLVLSFHGWTGCGKNHVSKMIAQHLFKEGLKSKYVVQFISTLHFSKCLINSCADESQLAEYRAYIQSRVIAAVTECQHALFIFDETDKMPVGLVGTVAAFLDHRDAVDGVDFRFAVFLFLSNAGGSAVAKRAFDFYRLGRPREELTLRDLEGAIGLSVFNSGEGGLKQSSLIDHNLIDHFVPFLPLERKHVELCVRDYLASKRIVFGSLRKSPSGDDVLTLFPSKENQFVSKVLDELDFDSYELYSVSGCKRVSAKVEALLPDFEEHLVNSPWRL